MIGSRMLRLVGAAILIAVVGLLVILRLTVGSHSSTVQYAGLVAGPEPLVGLRASVELCVPFLTIATGSTPGRRPGAAPLVDPCQYTGQACPPLVIAVPPTQTFTAPAL